MEARRHRSSESSPALPGVRRSGAVGGRGGPHSPERQALAWQKQFLRLTESKGSPGALHHTFSQRDVGASKGGPHCLLCGEWYPAADSTRCPRVGSDSPFLGCSMRAQAYFSSRISRWTDLGTCRQTSNVAYGHHTAVTSRGPAPGGTLSPCAAGNHSPHSKQCGPPFSRPGDRASSGDLSRTRTRGHVMWPTTRTASARLEPGAPSLTARQVVRTTFLLS